MAHKIKIKCNGPEPHINEVDLDKALATRTVARGDPRPNLQDIPARLVLRCKHCAEGRIVITRRIIEEVLG